MTLNRRDGRVSAGHLHHLETVRSARRQRPPATAALAEPRQLASARRGARWHPPGLGLVEAPPVGGGLASEGVPSTSRTRIRTRDSEKTANNRLVRI
jgi:hypothetical protein